MEEIRLSGGRLQNASFTDYLIPTILDMPPVEARILELPQADSPYGLNGIAEAPTIASTAAIVAAMRAASHMPLTRCRCVPTTSSASRPRAHEARRARSPGGAGRL